MQSVAENEDEGLQRDLGLYTQFMTEVKDRISAIKRLLDRIHPDAPPVNDGYVEVESCILQVRYICELIALASLSAHNQLGLPNDLYREGHASKAFSLLKRLNGNCFPRAISLNRSAHGMKIDLLKTELTMMELKSIYGQCGSLLHRGLLKQALAGEQRHYDVDALQS